MRRATLGRRSGSALAFGRALAAELDAFVHPRTRAGAPSTLLAEVDTRLRTRHTRTRDVKHFDGGIRSIEFTVQALQLLHGADATLRAAGTLAAIDRLAGAGILTDDEAQRLRRAYQTLRRIEHMLQLDAFEQTHTLPEDEDGRRRLAWALGLADAAELDDLIARVRADVRAVTGAVFAMRVDEGGGWSEARLAELGFADPAGAMVLVDALVRGRQRKPHTAPLRARAAAMADALLPKLAATALPDNALRTLEQVVDGVQSAEHVIAYLEHPRTRAALVALAVHAPVQVRRIVTAPLVLDAVFGGRASEAGMELGPELLRLVRDTDALVRWSLGGIGIAELGVALSDTADLIVRGMWDAIVGDAPMCVVALGKYGSRELMPGSDLDVVFVVKPDEGFSLADAEEAVRGGLKGGAGGGTPPGPWRRDAARPLQEDRRQHTVPYEIDARLRPEGARSPLVTSIDAYRRYLASRAVLWEKQSLLRMRPVAGDAVVAAELQTLFSETVATVRPDTATAEAVIAMRLAMEPASRFRDDDHVDLKTGVGGLVDAEFAVQFHLLGSAPALPTPLANTFTALDAAVEDPARAHDRSHWTDLREAYHFLRTLQLHLRLVIDTPSNHPPADESQRLLLARAADAPDARTLFTQLHEARTRMRRAFLTLMRTGALES
jgi:[glutamine synthetase] adenylyltransferase / [glutamine synthetase]-adenylyl-L-tyrosine phosphorylase